MKTAVVVLMLCLVCVDWVRTQDDEDIGVDLDLAIAEEAGSLAPVEAIESAVAPSELDADAFDLDEGNVGGQAAVQQDALETETTTENENDDSGNPSLHFNVWMLIGASTVSGMATMLIL